MKKYLMTAVAALTFGGLMTSCTRDTDLSGAEATQSITEKYEQIFVTAFGQPAPTQTWGFGENTVASTRAMTRTDKPTKPSFRDGTNNLPDFSKPDKPTFYKTVAEAEAAGVTVIAAEGIKDINPQHNTAYSINSSTTFNQLQNFNGITLYVTENTTFSPSFSANGNTIIVTKDKKLTLKALNEKVNVYLAPGAELDLSEYSGDVSFNNNGNSTPYKLYLSAGSKITGGNICVDNGYQVLNDGGNINSTSIRVQKSTLWNEGKIDLSGDLWSYNGFANIFNAEGDTISVGGKLELTNNNDLLYNNGYMPITGDIKMKDGSNEIVNNGTLNSSGDLNMKAGGKFHNVGYSTISGRSYIYNTNSYWVNDGHYTTGTFDDQNCEKVFNNCYMTVIGDFHLGVPAAANGHSFFTIEGGGEKENESGAYVYCGGSFIYGGNTDLWLGNKSYLEVIGEFKSTNINKTYGTHGPESGSYAVIKASSFTQDSNAAAAECCMTYYGKLYIDASTHYSNYIVDGTNVLFSSTHPEKPVSIPKTGCSPGYGGGGGGGDTDPEIVRIIAEDLTWGSENGDFDFNDVIFDVQLINNGSIIKITLLAAGGTLPLYIAGVEVHEKFGVSTSTMVNTYTDNNGNLIKDHNPVSFTIPNQDKKNYVVDDNGNETYPPYGSTVKEVAWKLPVEVLKLLSNGNRGLVELTAPVGKAAAKVAVGNDYNEWCPERTSVDDKFFDHSLRRGKFSMYVKKEAPYAEDNSWYK
jgi:hypothetical protein